MAIMADRMKKQQEEARAEALRVQQMRELEQGREQQGGAATTAKAAKAGGSPAQQVNGARATRQTRTSARQAANSNPSGSGSANGAVKAEEEGGQQQPPQQATKSRRGRGRKPAATGNTISSYFQKADVSVDREKPTVQEALEHAADEYEANPTALGGQELVATQQPELVTGGRMKKYQLEGLEWLKSLWMNGLCGILADEMGLGKTVQAISLLAFFKEKNVSGPFLIAAPLSTVSNWVDEFAKWTPGIKTVLYHGTKDQRAELRRKFMNMRNQREMDFPVVCTSYEICMNDRKFLAQYQWRYIIVVCSHSRDGAGGKF